jgi:chemotaxis protein histidine kinase CheA
MLNKSEFHIRLLLNLLTHKLAVFPFMTGVTSWVIAAMVDGNSAITFVFVGIASIVLSIGSIFTRLILNKEEIAQSIVAEIEDELSKARNKQLRDLRWRLSQDGDPRDEKLLDDLMEIANAFKQAEQWFSLKQSFEILAKVEELFQACVRQLERALQLKLTADKISSSGANKPLLSGREKILKDVKASIKKLSSILVTLSSISVNSTDDELRELQESLDEDLEIARRVDEQMKIMRGEFDENEFLTNQ